MRVVVASLVCASYLFANNINAVIEDVSKLRAKYDECMKQNDILKLPSAKDDNYNKEINRLKETIKTRVNTIDVLEEENKKIKKELTQKQGVISSLERSLTTKDEQLRRALSDVELYKKNNHNSDISKAEREQLRKALIEAKSEKEKLEKSMGKNSKDVIAIENELKNTKDELSKLQKELVSVRSKPNTPVVSEKVVEKIVYKDNPQMGEYDKLIKSLQLELRQAEATIVNLKNTKNTSSTTTEKIVYVDKPVEKIVEKVVYRDKSVSDGGVANSQVVKLQNELKIANQTIDKLKSLPKTVEKVVYKEKPVEKIVYKDKIVTETKETYEKISKLQDELKVAKLTIERLKNSQNLTEKIVYVDKPVEKIVEKIVYRNAPVSQNIKQSSVKSEPVTIGTKTSDNAKPSAYRMAKNAPIYSAPNGSVVDNWEERRSFTSGTSTTGWVKITGYFVDRVWQRADEDLWVKESDVIKRD